MARMRIPPIRTTVNICIQEEARCKDWDMSGFQPKTEAGNIVHLEASERKLHRAFKISENTPQKDFMQHPISNG